MDDLFLIAKVKAIYGSNGFVLIDSFSDFYERFFQLNSVYVEVFGSVKKFFVEDVKEVDGSFVIKFKGFDSSEDVQFFIGRKVYVEKKDVVKLSENVFFIHDVIGSKVFKESKLIGVVEDVWVVPANDVFVVIDQNKKRILVPAVENYIESFDADEKSLKLVSGCDLLYDDEN